MSFIDLLFILATLCAIIWQVNRMSKLLVRNDVASKNKAISLALAIALLYIFPPAALLVIATLWVKSEWFMFVSILAAIGWVLIVHLLVEGRLLRSHDHS